MLSAFGQTVASSGNSTDTYQYGATSGYRTEGDAGLTLVGCRFYDAQVGRFISRDTYQDQPPYAYCDGDPVNATDPSGHISFPHFMLILVCTAIVAVIMAVITKGVFGPGPIIVGAIVGAFIGEVLWQNFYPGQP